LGSTRVVVAGVAGLLVVIAAACASHDDGRAKPSSPTTTAFSMATTLTLPPEVSTTTSVPVTCAPLEAGDVAAALGVDISEVQPVPDPERPDEAPCAFRSGVWSISADRNGNIPPMTDTSADAGAWPSVPGVDIPSALLVGIQRGGHFGGQASFADGDASVTVWVANDGEGPDTWSTTPGPLQGPRTEEVTIAVAQRVAARL
jgi:hypothetical protein